MVISNAFTYIGSRYFLFPLDFKSQAIDLNRGLCTCSLKQETGKVWVCGGSAGGWGRTGEVERRK